MTNRILIADDDRDNRESLADLFEQYNPDCVDNGPAFVRGILSGHYFLGFTDIEMPEGNGLDAVQRIRAAQSGIPVYVMGSLYSQEAEALALGANGFFKKPYEIEQLEQAVQDQVPGEGRVLFADDDPLLPRSFRRIVSSYRPDIVVELAVNGQELVTKARSRRYDLIFSDKNMPELNGDKAIVEIRRFHPTVPIYFMTDDPNVATIAQQIGATGYFSKPNVMEPIEAALTKHIPEPKTE